MDISDWNDAVGVNEDAISMKEMDKLVKDYVEKREGHEAAKKLASEAYNLREEAEFKVLSALKAAGKTKYVVEGVGTFSIVCKEQVTVPKTIEDKDKLFAWIRQTYGEDILKDMVSIHSAKLNSFYKDAAEQAEDRSTFSIPGIDQPVVREEVRFNRSK